MSAPTFAAYLARSFIAKKGYRTEVAPEAAALAEACDIVLTYADGMSFRILCIVDCEAHPGRRFVLSPEALHDIGKACLKYGGKVHGNLVPVLIQVMEVGGRVGAVDQERLKAYKRHSTFSKVLMQAWIVSPSERAVWTNAPFAGWLAGRRFIERLMASPRATEAELAPPAPAALARTRFPVLTCLLLALLAAAFGAEQALGIGPSSGLLAPSVRTLLALGGLNAELVLRAGEWYRVFSAALLHGDALHLVLNGLALYLAGTLLESLVGRAWFLALFVVGTLGGSLASLALNPPTTVSVGASGAIMGLLAAALTLSLRFPAGAARTRMQMSMLQVLIPSLIPLAVSRTGSEVDFASHLGGTLSGALVGLALLSRWPAAQACPPLRPLAAGIALAGVAAFAFAPFPIKEHYVAHALQSLLIPRSQLPESRSDALTRSGELLARYPRDPRSHLFHADALLERDELAEAEKALRAGLAETEMLQSHFEPELELRMRTLLALVLSDRGQAAEARIAAQPVCGARPTGSLRKALDEARLCEK
jgi:rhomboid protease GluP